MSNIMITGAGQGIGYYMAEGLLLNGHSVGVLDLDISGLQPLKEKYGDKLLACVCDMRDTQRVNECVSKFAGAFSGIDIAIHNACRCTFTSMDATSEDTFQDVFDVNCFGAFRLAKAVLPFMQQRQSGKVIFTSSGVGVTGFLNISPYASSKGAIEALAKCLNLEYQSSGITFHIIHPPLTRTKSSDPFPLPAQYKADPKAVGYLLAKRIRTKSFLICHSPMQKFQMRLSYLFSLKMGKMMSDKLTDRFGQENKHAS